MENVTYPNSGALNRAHFALVTKQEQAFSGLDADRATRDTFESIKSRMKGKRGSPGTNVAGVTNVMESSISGLLAAGARSWGLRIPTIAPGWDSVRPIQALWLICILTLPKTNEIYEWRMIETSSRGLTVVAVLSDIYQRERPGLVS